MVYDTPYYLTVDECERPSIRVIQAVSSLINAERGELRPLRSAIDPGVLDRMVTSESERSTSFEYEGFHVTVRNDRTIILRNPESIHTTLTTESSVLLVTPRADDRELCTDLLHPYPLSRENVLHVTVDQSADETLDEWQAQDLEVPAERKIISLGDFARSAGTQTVTLPGSIEADLISDPQDLSTLHERIENTLSEWQSNPHDTVLCFHSIDAVLAQTGLDATFSFFNTLTSQIADSVSVAHYHVDPLKCDSTAVTTLLPLFDIAVYGDGEHTASVVK